MDWTNSLISGFSCLTIVPILLIEDDQSFEYFLLIEPCFKILCCLNPDLPSVFLDLHFCLLFFSNKPQNNLNHINRLRYTQWTNTVRDIYILYVRPG